MAKTKDTNQTTTKSKTEIIEKVKETSKTEISLESKIYGDEAEKNTLPFPQSDLETQTKKLVLLYDINVSRLPINLVEAINSFIEDFSVFVTNPMQVNLIGVIMEKDTIAFNLINKWADSKKELLLELKDKNKSEKTEINQFSPNSQQANQQVNSAIEGNIFPRQPISTYQHNISASTAPIQNNVLNGVFPTGENKNIHYEILSNAYPQIRANDTAQQNWQGASNQHQVVAIDKDKIFTDYCNSISSLIKSTFQVTHWGYIPLDALNTILNTCEKQYTYEIVNNGDNSFIKISYTNKTINTSLFNIK